MAATTSALRLFTVITIVSALSASAAEALWTIGAPSPSQVAVPSAPLTRHSPFQDVGIPSAHQLPL